MKKEHALGKAKRFLEGRKGMYNTAFQRGEDAIALAADLLEAANAEQTRAEKRLQRQLGRMMEDPRGKAFTTTMTDTAFRSRRMGRVATQMAYLLDRFGIPKYLNWTERLKLAGFKWVGRWVPWISVPIATYFLRKQMEGVILPGEAHALKHHMQKRRKQGVRINLNHLGEAILGEEEAMHRLDVYLEDLSHPEVEYISIKVSTICSQINLLAWEETLAIIKPRLRKLYRAAMAHEYQRADGTKVPKFVNLDMEEYRDLHLTVALFQSVLDEPEFHMFRAGIVLQAYLPDSYPIQQQLTQWAIQRIQNGGAPIKIRIVKGANLAMERVESSIHRWPQPPYPTKVEVDANYKRMATFGCEPNHAQAVHLGIGSHNLFDIAYILILRAEKGVENEVTFEMLEGMADHIRRVAQKVAGEILLYCPAARKRELQNAIAYLIRRLDENTGEENFLRHAFGMWPGSRHWKEQVAEFQSSVYQIDKVSTTPRRYQDRRKEPEDLPLGAPFANEPDTDITFAHNQSWALHAVSAWKNRAIEPIPLVIKGHEVLYDRDRASGTDPSAPNQEAYHYTLATTQDIEEALECAKKAFGQWQLVSVTDRSRLLAEAAKQFRRHRGDLMGAMMLDGGKRIPESDPEVSEAIDFLEYYRRQAEELLALCDVEWRPKGTVLVTPPWNFPCAIPAGGIAAALATGNTVLFKPAPEAVLVGWELVKLFWQAGIPKDVLQFVNCVDDPVGSHLICHEQVDAVILTGGTATARLFKHMRPNLDLMAETGGKNGIIVSDLADRDLAIKAIVHSAFGHSGQKCSAASLAILHKEVYDDPHFLAQLRDAAASLTVGSAWNPKSVVTPLIHPPEGALKKGLTFLEKGETWLLEPKADPHNPHLWSPGVKMGTKPGGYSHQTEFFGPVLALIRADSLADAIRIANDTPYGLTAGLQSLDEREIQQWLAEIQAGNLYVNRSITGAIVQRQPFGGCKASSFGPGGKAGGPNYLPQLMHATSTGEPAKRRRLHRRLRLQLPIVPSCSRTAFQYSLESYLYWWNLLQKGVDPSLLIGQDNVLKQVPYDRVLFRVHPDDAALDTCRVLTACELCGTFLEISAEPQTPIAGGNRSCVIHETQSAFIERVASLERPRIRTLQPPSQELVAATALAGGYVASEPVSANGWLELAHYTREVAISTDYHRYGNLGVREVQDRAPLAQSIGET